MLVQPIRGLARFGGYPGYREEINFFLEPDEYRCNIRALVVAVYVVVWLRELVAHFRIAGGNFFNEEFQGIHGGGN